MRTIASLLAVLALALAGCGGGDESTPNAGGGGEPSETATSTPEASGGGGQQIALAAPADGALKFEPADLKAKAGKVTIDFDNPASIPHAVDIEGNGVDADSEEVTNDKTSVTADLKPGTYTFFCPVPGHREGGMEGTLTVE